MFTVYFDVKLPAREPPSLYDFNAPKEDLVYVPFAKAFDRIKSLITARSMFPTASDPWEHLQNELSAAMSGMTFLCSDDKEQDMELPDIMNEVATAYLGFLQVGIEAPELKNIVRCLVKVAKRRGNEGSLMQWEAVQLPSRLKIEKLAEFLNQRERWGCELKPSGGDWEPSASSLEPETRLNAALMREELCDVWSPAEKFVAG